MQSTEGMAQMSEYDLNWCCMLASIPMITIIPIRGIFYSFFRRRNIRISKTIVIIKVITLKCSNNRLRTLKGEVMAPSSDIKKNASVF